LMYKVTAHLVANILVFSFVKIALQFTLSAASIDPKQEQTRDNFCAGSFINNLEIAGVSELIRIGTALLWFFILLRVRPFHFFNRIYYTFVVLLVALTAIIPFNTNPHVSAVVLALMTGIAYLVGNYDNVIVSAGRQ